MFIYEIRNLTNGKRYIGQTIRTTTIRFAEHRAFLKRGAHPNAHLQRAWNIDGEANFVFTELAVCESVDEMNKMETELIDGGYNLQSGGRKGCTYSEEIRKKQSNKALERYSNPDERIKMSHAVSRSKQTIESRKSASESARRQWKSKEVREKMRNGIRIALQRQHAGVVDPNGVVYNPIMNLKAFCREHQLDSANMNRLVKGRQLQYKGWKKL